MTMYHVSSVSPRSIMRVGIDHLRARNKCECDGECVCGNYLWPTLASALKWAKRYRLKYIYVVNVSGLRLHRDPYWDFLPRRDPDYREFIGPRGGIPRAFYSITAIAPRRIAPMGSSERIA